MPSMIDPSMSVAQLVVDRPGRSRLLEQMHIDYCCGGKIPLHEACRRRGLDVSTVVDRLVRSDTEASRSDSPAPVDPSAMSLTDLADHIEDTHHAYLRTELPRLRTLIEKVAQAHGAEDVRLHSVRDAFNAFSGELS
ncbi:MAG: DUF542 domain-containing protein, partial [Phycisphaerae bacterium]|nr:DUF542 domain-containing protein [Phycisphaerae bacterium]